MLEARKVEGDFEENVGRAIWDIYMPLIPIRAYMRVFANQPRK
jgi:hypothetical protein